MKLKYFAKDLYRTLHVNKEICLFYLWKNNICVLQVVNVYLK